MRPVSMQWFSRFFLATIALGVLSIAVNWPALMTNLAAHAFLGLSGMGFLIGALMIGCVINLLLWYFIVWRASNLARWIWAVVAMIGLPGSVGAILRGNNPPSPLLVTVIAGVTLALNVVNLILIFRADSRAWFASKGKVIDPGVFS